MTALEKQKLGKTLWAVDDATYQNLLEQISRAYAKGRSAALQAVNTQLLEAY
jgi:hypothetical protein